MQSKASDAILAGGTFLDHQAIDAVTAVHEEAAVIASLRCDAFVTALTGIERESVDCVFAEGDVISVQAIFVIPSTPNEMAIFHVERVIRKVTILRIAREEIHARNL